MSGKWWGPLASSQTMHTCLHRRGIQKGTSKGVIRLFKCKKKLPPKSLTMPWNTRWIDCHPTNTTIRPDVKTTFPNWLFYPKWLGGGCLRSVTLYNCLGCLGNVMYSVKVSVMYLRSSGGCRTLPGCYCWSCPPMWMSSGPLSSPLKTHNFHLDPYSVASKVLP